MLLPTRSSRVDRERSSDLCLRDEFWVARREGRGRIMAEEEEEMGMEMEMGMAVVAVEEVVVVVEEEAG